MQSAPSMDPVEHAAGLRRLALRLADPNAADDLVQSTWVRALEHGAAAVRAPASWLRQIMRNEHRMAIRGGRRMHAREQAVAALDDRAVDVEGDAHARDVARIVGELVDDLDDEVREVVRQRYFDGLSAAEIARMRSIPAGTVRWRLKTGIDRLRAELDARYGERALWAGLFVPLPTLGDGAASLAPTATNTAAEGTNMLTKIIIGTTLAAGTTAGVVAYTRTQTPEPVATAQAPTPIETTTTPVAAKPKRAMDRAELAQARKRWTKQVAGIRATQQKARAPGAMWTQAVAEHDTHGCGDMQCLAQLAAQVSDLVQGCKDLAEDLPSDVKLTAHVIGAKEMGAVIESVALQGAPDAPAELTECLTESMYALELDALDADIDQDITVLLKNAADSLHLDLMEVGGTELQQLDEATRTKMMSELGLGDLPPGSTMYMIADDTK